MHCPLIAMSFHNHSNCNKLLHLPSDYRQVLSYHPGKPGDCASANHSVTKQENLTSFRCCQNHKHVLLANVAAAEGLAAANKMQCTSNQELGPRAVGILVCFVSYLSYLS